MTRAALAAARMGLILWRPPPSILRALEVLDELRQPKAAEVGARLGCASVASTYQRLDTLVWRGLAEEVDGRPRRYRLTRAGRELLRRAD